MTWCKVHEQEQDLHCDLKLSTCKQMFSSEPGYRLGSEEKYSWSFVEVEQNCWARNSPKETVLMSSWDAFLNIAVDPVQHSIRSSGIKHHGLNFTLEATLALMTFTGFGY